MIVLRGDRTRYATFWLQRRHFAPLLSAIKPKAINHRRKYPQLGTVRGPDFVHFPERTTPPPRTTTMMLGRIHSVLRLGNTPNILPTTHPFRTFLTQTQSPPRLPSIPLSLSPILTQLRTYKLKSCSVHSLTSIFF